MQNQNEEQSQQKYQLQSQQKKNNYGNYFSGTNTNHLIDIQNFISKFTVKVFEGKLLISQFSDMHTFVQIIYGEHNWFSKIDNSRSQNPKWNEQCVFEIKQKAQIHNNAIKQQELTCEKIDIILIHKLAQKESQVGRTALSILELYKSSSKTDWFTLIDKANRTVGSIMLSFHFESINMIHSNKQLSISNKPLNQLTPTNFLKKHNEQDQSKILQLQTSNIETIQLQAIHNPQYTQQNIQSLSQNIEEKLKQWQHQLNQDKVAIIQQKKKQNGSGSASLEQQQPTLQTTTNNNNKMIQMQNKLDYIKQENIELKNRDQYLKKEFEKLKNELAKIQNEKILIDQEREELKSKEQQIESDSITILNQKQILALEEQALTESKMNFEQLAQKQIQQQNLVTSLQQEQTILNQKIKINNHQNTLLTLQKKDYGKQYIQQMINSKLDWYAQQKKQKEQEDKMNNSYNLQAEDRDKRVVDQYGIEETASKIQKLRNYKAHNINFEEKIQEMTTEIDKMREEIFSLSEFIENINNTQSKIEINYNQVQQ